MAKVRNSKIACQIQVTNLNVIYGKNRIINNLNLQVAAGEFVAIVGKSGVGKSTLLNALAGFIKYEGQISISGRLGFVFQGYAVFPWLTVAGNIGAGVRTSSRPERKQIIKHYIELAGLAGHESKYPAQLSGGQTQRVALARALAAEPELLLCDEPFGSLDIYTRERMQRWLLELWEANNKTVLFVTHSVDEAMFLSHRVLVMGNGGIRSEVLMPFPRPRLEQLRFDKVFIDLKRQILEDMDAVE